MTEAIDFLRYFSSFESTEFIFLFCCSLCSLLFHVLVIVYVQIYFRQISSLGKVLQ